MYFLDLEERETSLSSSEIFQWVRTFLETSASRFGRSQIGIYTSSNYLREKNLQSYDYLSQYHLWAASWSSQPLVTPWTTWDTWQYTDKGSVEWCKGPIDLNRRVVYNHDVPLES
jgi:GH25 family lysozyme M1 (1,4-beta-N-acetylmuramidase)